MYIHRADTGLVYTIEVDSSITVTQLKEFLRAASKIPPEDQILLCDGTKLDNNNTLKIYGLPDDNKHVFLYDRKSLEPDSPAPEEVVLPSVELKVAPVPPLPRNQELEYKESPLLWQLITFENQFLGDLNNSEALKKVVEARIDICKSLLSEQENQVKGLNAAIANLNDHLNQITQAFGAFHTYYKQLQNKHEHLLRSFDADMQKLREAKLHPALARPRMSTLMDFVPEPRLIKWAQDCGNEHEQLKNLVVDLEKQISFVRDSTENENKTAPEVDFNMLRSQIKRANEISSEVTVRYHIFSNDYNNVRQRAQEAKSNQNLNKQSLWEICESFEQISREHKRQLAQMNDHDQTMKSIMSFCAASKTKLSRCVHERLRSIALIQSKIRELANKIIVFNEAVARQKTAFQQLIYVQSMPKAYQAAIEEVSHRRRFRRNIATLTSKFMETLSKLKDDEMQRRQQFLSTYGRYVPKDIIPGLNSGVPAFEFELPQFDTQLPQIDLPNDNNNASSSDSLGEEDFAMVLSSEPIKSSRLQELEKENDSLLNQIKALKADLNSGINLNSSSSGLSNLPQKSSITTSNISNTSSTADLVNDYKKRIESLELKLSTTYAQMEQAESAAKEFREKWNAAEKEIRSSVMMQSKEQASQLETKIQQMEQDIDFLTAKLRKTESSLEDSLAKESAFAVKLDIANDTIAQQQQQIKDAETLIQTLQDQLADLSTHSENQTNQAKNLGEVVSNLATEKEALFSEHSALQQQFEILQNEYSQLQKQHEYLTDSVKSLDTKYLQATQMESDLKSNIAELSDQCNNQAQQIAALSEELNARNQQVQSLEAQNQQHREHVGFLQKQIAELNQSKHSSEKKDQNFEKVLQDKEETVQKTLSELKTVSAKYTEAVKILEAKNKQNTELLQGKAALEQKIASLEESNKALNHELKHQLELVQHYLDSDQLARTIVQDITKLLQSTPNNNNQNSDLLVIEDDNTVPKLLTDLKQRVSELLHHCTVLESTVAVLKDKVSAFELQFEDTKQTSKTASSSSQSKLVFSGFKPEDYVVFVTNKNGHYEAVNSKAPNYFLSPDVQEAILGENSKSKPPIYGQILHITDHVASSGSNPFTLPSGTAYHEVIIISEQ
eukprot:CAMPEP_0168566166 /NCGR_PEP_ID=MMETSP0413-20121227/14264_1 /TAXON_ID=136452 /ORGANISM="Filamoeba nolandi, Strain NC-AS-23-1" /LENGTH=1125 /DNA_ID=CAMNT_0008598147 /DNA_START=70 /DNA_END=3447 /DNA_ORIENTATION=+